MGWISRAVVAALLAAIASASTSSSSFISDGLLDSSESTGGSRSLLQTKRSCAVNFEFMNYTILTSRCRGPKYSRDTCCDSFLQFACPYADEINDLNTDCSTTMFSYINLYGHYPPGLFANICPGDKNGLPCPQNYTKPVNVESAATFSTHRVSLAALVVAAAITLFSFS